MELYFVMAVYNGARYLAPQLDSIVQQSEKDWHLLVRDDGSSDNSIEVVKDYAQRDSRIELISDDLGNLGPSNCFGALLEIALERGAKYVACCDQDDVWLGDKVRTTLNELKAQESKLGADTPVLISTDLKVVDENLDEIAESFMRHENIPNPGQPSLSTLLVQNHVVGCTMMGNRALLQVALPIPSEVRMHDWWLALCAKAAGELYFLPQSTLKYRQHGANTLGASGFSHIFHIAKASWWHRLAKRPRLHHALMCQAGALFDRLNGRPFPGNKELTVFLGCTRRATFHERWRCARDAKIEGQNWVTSLFFYLFLLAGYAKHSTSGQ